MDILKSIKPGTILLQTAVALSVCQVSIAQISPGPLSEAHADLEGISNCTKCHGSGQEIVADKCLSCHAEIKNEISGGHGFHFENRNSSCTSCHVEHLGREAKITRFDEKNFDHSKTGFVLTGAHQSLRCEQCHAGKNIVSGDIKKILAAHPHKTYQGLSPQCVSCHADRHKGTVGVQCQTCHGTKSWSPPVAFDHKNTKFTLIGKHQQVPCAQCHLAMAVKSSTEPVLFTTKSFEDCTPCHASPHGRKFTDQTCRSCHTPAGWSIVVSFDHSTTRFPLIGEHARVACEKCHTQMNNKRDKVVSFATLSFTDCTPCHKSPHNARFNTRECRSCHTATDWASLLGRFDHTLTNYRLEGKHELVKCEQCHKPSLGTQFSARFLIPSRHCTDCHEDYHNGQFKVKYANNCAECHTVKGFAPSTFSIESHQSSLFTLTGAHIATPCNACHKKEEGKAQIFVFANFRCESCHEDFHKGQFRTEMAEHSCAQCHSTTGWSMTIFDHSKTKFPLVGKHKSVKCSDCHKETVVHGVKQVQYVGLPTRCESCHKDVHFDQFADRGRTECASCHSPAGWHALLFDHETQSTFHLTGAHKNVACGGCHKEERVGSVSFVRYKPLDSRCESCHAQTKL